MNRLLITVLVACAGLFSSTVSSAAEAVYHDLAEVPVLHEGRVKPLDSFARIHLLAFSGKSKLPDGQLAIG